MMFLINTWYRIRQAGWRANLAFILLFTIFVMNVVVLTAGGAAAKVPSLEQVNLLTIDTHKVGQLPADTKSKNPIEKGKQAVNKVTDTAKKATGVQQWYSYHLLTTCSGAFAKDGKTKKDVQCKKPQLSHFSTEPIDGLKKGLKDGIAGDALGKGVKDVGRWLGFVAWLYLGSLLASAALMLLKIKSVLISPLGHRLVGVQLWISLGTMAMLVAASAGENIFANMLATVINVGGGLVGVKAKVGSNFISLTWALTILMFLVTILSYLEKRRFLKYGYGY